ncbi:MAG: hypothetical protein JO171_00920 [Paludibacterium sp.]|uniref:I78 family peptidase inhibitor n=1 Tax=Paludibacterium sp. TaxID=1917523 RepID=UPI0025D35536|nr:I78 family peptidase inhibitor [Paludibacterium sp.]MBV8045686.1 hypothetical protein [Paludibacterium sp.]
MANEDVTRREDGPPVVWPFSYEHGIPWPWQKAQVSVRSLAKLPREIQDLIGLKLRVIRPGEMASEELVPGRVSIYVDSNGVIADVTLG